MVTDLKKKHRELRDNESSTLALRLHRAISWLTKADQSDDLDSQFIFLWIAFNAAYSQETGLTHLSDGNKFRKFLQRIVELDDKQMIQKQLWDDFSQAIRVLLDNKYVYQPFWNHHNGLDGYEDWQKRFTKAKKVAQLALMKKDTATLLNIIFNRLYTLRNQIMHGGSTWNSQTNRQQLKDATNILSQIVPIIAEIMMDHPSQVWGEACYPVVK